MDDLSLPQQVVQRATRGPPRDLPQQRSRPTEHGGLATGELQWLLKRELQQVGGAPLSSDQAYDAVVVPVGRGLQRSYEQVTEQCRDGDSACTAFVGSLIPGERARTVTSTRLRRL